MLDRAIAHQRDRRNSFGRTRHIRLFFVRSEYPHSVKSSPNIFAQLERISRRPGVFEQDHGDPALTPRLTEP